MLILMRGLPGSGKSTLARSMIGGDNPILSQSSTIITSTDNYFIKNGVYQFVPTLLGYYHNLNLENASLYLKIGYNVIVDNTNTTFSEMKKYIEVALEKNHEVIFKEPDTPWKFDLEELTKRNTHQVPRESIKRMLDRWQSTEDCIKKLEFLKG